jgi:hypothetical protein
MAESTIVTMPLRFFREDFCEGKEYKLFVPKVYSLPQNFINLIGHDYRDKTITTSELAVVRGFNVFFEGEIQKLSSVVESRLRILRNGVVVFCIYSKMNQFSSEVRNGITMSAPGDIIIIDEVLLKKDDKIYPILGVELEVQ